MSLSVLGAQSFAKVSLTSRFLKLLDREVLRWSLLLQCILIFRFNRSNRLQLFQTERTLKAVTKKKTIHVMLLNWP